VRCSGANQDDHHRHPLGIEDFYLQTPLYLGGQPLPAIMGRLSLPPMPLPPGKYGVTKGSLRDNDGQ